MYVYMHIYVSYVQQKYCFLRKIWATRSLGQFYCIWFMNKFCLQWRSLLSCPIIRWNKPKDKENQEVILLAILSCNFCKTFPAVQDCSKPHMLRLTCCAKKRKKKKLADSCWERFSRMEKELRSSCCCMALGLGSPLGIHCICFSPLTLIGRIDLP